MCKLLFSLLLIPSIIISLEAGDKAKMLQDLEIIKSTFETKYAPYEWKKSYFGWSLEEEIQSAKLKILSLNSLSVKDYQRILHAFFISTRDYHVHDQYHSTEMAMLPFNVRSINGKYFITEINRDLLLDMKKHGLISGKGLPQVGNEVITFDAKPIHKVIKELKLIELGNTASKTAQTLAESLLTKRLGSRAHTVPKGSIPISLKDATGKTIHFKMTWLYIPEKISSPYYTGMGFFDENEEGFIDYPFQESELEEPNFQKKSEPLDYFSNKPKMMINHLAEELQKDHTAAFRKALTQLKGAASYHEELTEPEEALPVLPAKAKAIERHSISFGKKIWEESPKSPFKVHIYQLPGTNKNIGYIRISTYAPSQDLNALSQMVIRLAKSIRYLEQHTDALVVDQVDNPGGVDLYALAIASMLTDHPLKLPKNHLLLTQAEIAKAFSTLDNLEDLVVPDQINQYTLSSFIVGYPINQEFVNKEIAYQNFLINQWNEGKNFTEAYPLSGIDCISPHPLASYSKPILVLVNSNDFSCADFFPAILQDNKRALIFGEQTAGAGGFVETHSYPNSFGLAMYSYTTSIAERLDGSVIENLGVTPDIPYELTESDLLNGYQGYIQEVNKTLSLILDRDY